MAEEFFDQREQELLDYFRNNFTDPSARGTDTSDSFTATAGQTIFELTNVLVKNVAETITVEGVTKRKGYDFTVEYGEGNHVTNVVLNTGAILNDTVIIEYHYGSSAIEREYSRTDVILPRIVMMFMTGGEIYAGLGDAMESSKGSYFVASYRIEIRDRYASRARRSLSTMFNLVRKLRHQNLFRMIISKASNVQNFDYDREKEAYIWQFTLNIQWDLLFE